MTLVNFGRSCSDWIKANNDVAVVVFNVCVMGFGTMLAMMCVETTMLLYMNHVNFTSYSDSTFFVQVQAIGLIVPLCAAVPLGYLSTRFGPRWTLTLAYLTVFLGYFFMSISGNNPYLYVFGYICYVTCSGFRIVRYALIGDFVPNQHRTLVMAIHQFMTPLGFIFAPIVWLFLQNQELTIIQNTFVLDKFSLNFLFCMFVSLLMAVSTATTLRLSKRSQDRPVSKSDQPTNSEQLAIKQSSPINYGSVLIHLSNGTFRIVNIRKYRDIHFVFFTAVILLTRLTFNIILCVFQPILIGYFKSDEHEMGMIYLLIGVLSLLPPLLVATVSSKMSDRYILLFGLLCKLAGASMFLPLFGPVKKWQPIVGYILAIKASSFCTTSTISLFTKVLGPLSSAKVIGYLWSLSNLAPALVQIIYSSQIVRLFSTWGFSIFIVPVMVSVCLVLCPPGWSLLNDSSEFTHRVLEAAQPPDKSIP